LRVVALCAGGGGGREGGRVGDALFNTVVGLRCASARTTYPQILGKKSIQVNIQYRETFLKHTLPTKRTHKPIPSRSCFLTLPLSPSLPLSLPLHSLPPPPLPPPPLCPAVSLSPCTPREYWPSQAFSLAARVRFDRRTQYQNTRTHEHIHSHTHRHPK
jgi:hypothetical protein